MQKPFGTTFLFLAAMLAFSAQAMAAVDKAKIETLVKEVSGGQARVVDVFAGPDGLTGMVLKGLEEDSPQVIGWVPQGERFVVVGNVYDRSGSNLTDEAAIQFIGDHPEISATEEPLPVLTPDQSYDLVQTLAGVNQVAMKEPRNTLYVMFESSCWYCLRLHRQLTQAEEQFKTAGLQVKWIPIGYEGPSRERGAQILAQGLGAMKDGSQPATKENLEAVDNNSLAMLQMMSQISTPTLIWKGMDGVHTYIGAPESGELQEMIEGLAAVAPKAAKK